MNGKRRPALSFLFMTLTVCSCVPRFEQPLPLGQWTASERCLLGTWDASADDGSGVRLTFEAGPRGGLELAMYDLHAAEEDGYKGRVEGHVASVAGNTFLSTRRVAPTAASLDDADADDDVDPYWYLTWFEVEEDELRIRHIDQQKVLALVERGLLAGHIEERTWSRSVTVTAASTAMVDVLVKHGIDGVVAAKVATFHRAGVDGLGRGASVPSTSP